MSRFQPRIADSASVSSSANIADGQFIIATDSRQIFFDSGSQRLSLTDLVVVTTEEARLAISEPLPKLYLVTETKRIYYYCADQGWKNFSGPELQVCVQPAQPEPPADGALMLWIAEG